MGWLPGGDAPPNSKGPVVSVLNAQEAVVTVSLVTVMPLRQEQESSLGGPGVVGLREPPGRPSNDRAALVVSVMRAVPGQSGWPNCRCSPNFSVRSGERCGRLTLSERSGPVVGQSAWSGCLAGAVSKMETPGSPRKTAGAAGKMPSFHVPRPRTVTLGSASGIDTLVLAQAIPRLPCT